MRDMILYNCTSHDTYCHWPPQLEFEEYSQCAPGQGPIPQGTVADPLAVRPEYKVAPNSLNPGACLTAVMNS